MIKARIISVTMSLVGTMMIVMAFFIQTKENTDVNRLINNETRKINVTDMSVTNRNVETKIENTTVEKAESSAEESVEEVSMEQVPQAEYIPPRVEVYEGMTMEELAEKLNRSLGNGYISGKGELIASKCIELGVDPYVAVAIMLHETGCNSGSCSKLTTSCNNVGGQKGGPTCGNGSYKYYATIDEGIVGHIENLYKRYYSVGLNTVEAIGPRYAESNTWVSKINYFVNLIRSN